MVGIMRAEAVEEIPVDSLELLTTVREVIRHGNARRVRIMTSDRIAVIDIPRTLGRADATLDSVWRAVRAIGAPSGEWIVIVDRDLAWPCAPARSA